MFITPGAYCLTGSVEKVENVKRSDGEFQSIVNLAITGAMFTLSLAVNQMQVVCDLVSRLNLVEMIPPV